jgi:uncharacterized membrane protein
MKEKPTLGQCVADKIATGMGSWTFIILQSFIVLLWMGANVWMATHAFDPYPFVLLNLLFSTQAAYSAPVIMMSQNRQSAKDREQINRIESVEKLLCQMVEKTEGEESEELQLLRDIVKRLP